jgi:hypothetical protein
MYLPSGNNYLVPLPQAGTITTTETTLPTVTVPSIVTSPITTTTVITP